MKLRLTALFCVGIASPQFASWEPYVYCDQSMTEVSSYLSQDDDYKLNDCKQFCQEADSLQTQFNSTQDMCCDYEYINETKKYRCLLWDGNVTTI